jgi:MFS transporter, Spinster family, sphingosine-1-phosphate transporter
MRGNRGYLLILLTVILAFNQVDRLALGVVLDDIKRDLSLSDTQLGLLSGIAFAAFYALMGIPLARWADRGNRVTIIALTTTLWSATVALCALARSFTQLMLIRVGVAVGEAGCYPASLSLISDYFSRGERPRAVGQYTLGFSYALLLGTFAAGWLNQAYGWRTTFVVVGLPGLALGAIARVMLKEPRGQCGTTAPSSSDGDVNPAQSCRLEQPTLKQVCKTLWLNQAFRHLWLCFSVWGFFGYGSLQWQPAFYVRNFGLSSGELGTWLALVYGIGGLFGTWIGAELAYRYAAGNERRQLVAMAVSYAIAATVGPAVYLAPTYPMSFAALMLVSITTNAPNGPLFAATQTLVPAQMRAMSTALIYFFCNLIGLGLGPLAVGALSDAFTSMFHGQSLRYALLALSPGYIWCAWHLWKASRTVVRDIPRERDATRVATMIEQPLTRANG